MYTHATQLRNEDNAPDGFVVVTLWKYATSRSGALAYEHYARLEDAAAHYRNPGQQFTAHGIFAAKDGMPVGPPLDADVIASVAGGKPYLYGLREFQPNSPENMRYRERRHEQMRNGTDRETLIAGDAA